MNLKSYTKEANVSSVNFTSLQLCTVVLTASQFLCLMLVQELIPADVNHEHLLYFQFLCDRDGKPVKRYAPSVQPLVSTVFLCDHLSGTQYRCDARI